MGQSHSRKASKAAPSSERRTMQQSERHHNNNSASSDLNHPPNIVKPRDLVERDPQTAVRRILPMAHQKICHLPLRMDVICMKLSICPDEKGPDGGLGSTIRDLCNAMKKIYRYLCNPKRAPESCLPFSGPDLAEAIGILALKLERWVKDFEMTRADTDAIDCIGRRARELNEQCEQTRTVLLSIKSDRFLERQPVWSTSTDRQSRSMSGWRTSDSSQAGMGRSIFGV